MAFPLVFAPALLGAAGPFRLLRFAREGPRRRREPKIRGSRARIGTTPRFDRGQDEIAPDPDVMRSSFRGFAH